MDERLTRQVRDTLRAIPDYPKPGIIFQDITPVLANGPLFGDVCAGMAEPFRGRVTHVVGIEARGFILGGAVARELGVGFVPVRKPGKLPWKSVREEYQLEYGMDALEAHDDAVDRHARVVIVDDVLATGGTARATAALVRRLGAEVVGWSFMVEIAGLGGRSRLDGETRVICPV